MHYCWLLSPLLLARKDDASHREHDHNLVGTQEDIPPLATSQCPLGMERTRGAVEQDGQSAKGTRVGAGKVSRALVAPAEHDAQGERRSLHEMLMVAVVGILRHMAVLPMVTTSQWHLQVEGHLDAWQHAEGKSDRDRDSGKEEDTTVCALVGVDSLS